MRERSDVSSLSPIPPSRSSAAAAAFCTASSRASAIGHPRRGKKADNMSTEDPPARVPRVTRGFSASNGRAGPGGGFAGTLGPDTPSTNLSQEAL